MVICIFCSNLTLWCVILKTLHGFVITMLQCFCWCAHQPFLEIFMHEHMFDDGCFYARFMNLVGLCWKLVLASHSPCHAEHFYICVFNFWKFPWGFELLMMMKLIPCCSWTPHVFPEIHMKCSWFVLVWCCMNLLYQCHAVWVFLTGNYGDECMDTKRFTLLRFSSWDLLSYWSIAIYFGRVLSTYYRACCLF